MLLGAMVASCGSGSENQNGEEPEPSPEPEAEGGVDARALFSLMCAPCHGNDFRGTGEGADLTARLPTLTDEEAIESIQNGVPPGMPSWSGTLTDEEISALVDYLRSEIE